MKTHEVEKLDYEKMVEYKVRIFETIFPEKVQGAYADNIIDKVLKDVNKIYDNLSQKNIIQNK